MKVKNKNRKHTTSFQQRLSLMFYFLKTHFLTRAPIELVEKQAGVKSFFEYLRSPLFWLKIFRIFEQNTSQHAGFEIFKFTFSAVTRKNRLKPLNKTFSSNIYVLVQYIKFSKMLVSTVLNSSKFQTILVSLQLTLNKFYHFYYFHYFEFQTNSAGIQFHYVKILYFPQVP